MDLLVELSMEHPTLPAYEVRAVVDALGGAPAASREGPGVLVLEGVAVDPDELADRLGLAHRLMETWAEAEPTAEAAAAAVADLPEARLPPAGESFAVRVRRMGGAADAGLVPEVASQVGDALSGRCQVDLDAPDHVVRVLVTADRAYVGRVVAEVDRSAFEARHVEERPLFSPVSLHPRMARAMVNLAGLVAGDRVLDPFVGTGGVALEAGLVGCRVYAGDVDPRMVAGVADVLDEHGLEAEALEEADVGEAPDWVGSVEAVVTDPPYGRAATTDEEERGALYDRFLQAAEEVLVPGGRLVAAFPEEGDVDRVRGVLDVEAVHVQRVHGSLTRHVVVARLPD